MIRKKVIVLGAILIMAFGGMQIPSQASEPDQGMTQVDEQMGVMASRMSEAEKIFFGQLGRNEEVKTSPEAIPYRITDGGERRFVEHEVEEKR